MNTAEATESAIDRVVSDFQGAPSRYFTEEDVRWRLMREIEASLAALDASEVTLKQGIKTAAVHGEYPTPFRCSMTQRSFEVLAPTETRGHRGHFDIVVLNASTVADCDFQTVRSQNFDLLLNTLGAQSRSLIDTVVEIKLYRDLAYAKRRKSIQQAAEYAMQAVLKVAMALDAQRGYYSAEPFAKRGTVLLFDNSHLVADADTEPVRRQFQQVLEKELDWSLLPVALSCMWITPDSIRRYDGLRPPKCQERRTAP